MANLYWVGGTGNWSDDSNHWATSSGGSPNSGNIPDSLDDVFIDANSGFGSGGTISLDAELNCHDFTATSGDSYTITEAVGGSAIYIYGSLTLEAGITLTIPSFAATRFSSTSAGETITTAGIDIGSPSGIAFDGVGGSWTLQDDLEITGQFYQENGTFDANDHNITANDFYFYADTGYTPTVIMGSGTWEATGGDWLLDEYNGEVVVITHETSTIKISSEGVEFYSGTGKIYNNLWLYGPTPLNRIQVSSSNTFSELKIEAGVSVIFETGTTQTITTFVANGTLGNLIILDSDAGVDQFTLSKSSGIVSCDYLDISNSNATGGATWYAGANSADTTNNDGWIFEDAPSNLVSPFPSHFRKPE